MATAHLGIVTVVASQNQKEFTINNALEALDQAMNGGATALTITGNTTVTAAQLRAGFVIRLNGTPGAGFDLNIPAQRRFFAVHNKSGQTATVKLGAGSIAVANDARTLFYSDATDVFDF